MCGLVTWSCLMSRWESWRPTPSHWITLMHLALFDVQERKWGPRYDTMKRESSLCLAEPNFDYLLVVFQFQSGSNLRRLPRNIQVGLVGLCALADTCFHLENHRFKLLKHVSWMLPYQFWYEYVINGSPTLIWLTRDSGDNERDFRPRKPIWRPQLVQRRQGLTVQKKWHGSMWCHVL